MRRNPAMRVLGTAIVLASILAPAPSSATVSGPMDITMTCSFPNLTSGTAQCDGVAGGHVWGLTDGGDPYSAFCVPITIACPLLCQCTVTATFDYSETCIAGKPVVGIADGTIVIEDVFAIQNGLTTANIIIPFMWTHVERKIILLTGKLAGARKTVDFPPGFDDAHDLVGDLGTGEILFPPTSSCDDVAEVIVVLHDQEIL